MYNFNLKPEEEIKDIFENVNITKGEETQITTIALTNYRLLFLDYISDDVNDVLRIARGVSSVRYKEVYYEAKLDEIKMIEQYGKYFFTINNVLVEFDNINLYNRLKEQQANFLKEGKNSV